MPVRQRDFGDELAPPQPKRCRHCDETQSPCGGSGESEGSEGRESWRVTLDHDLVETLSAIYPEWFKPQHRARSRAASPAASSPPSDDALSWCADTEMAGRSGGSGSASEPAGSPPRVSPPKVVVDDSPLQPAMGKHKESLKVKLMMRRPINQLVAQGIMPPLKTPPAYFEQCKQLERAKTGDLLKAKIQRRPDRHELERRHILEQESHVDPSLAEKQRMLKKARLADQLNDQLSHRPGPLELIKKNILHTEETIETAVKSGTLAFKATSEGASGRPQHPSSYCGPPEEVSPSPSPPSTLSPASVASPPQHPAPGKDKNRKKSKQKQQPKARFKFHEYKGPPSAQKASSPPDSVETPYELLLQQQQMLLQLMLPASPAASVASDCSDAYPTPPPPPPLPLAPLVPIAPYPGTPIASRFEDMKVSDLRAECKRLNLRVSGPKPQLIERLRPFLIEKQEEAPKSPMSVASPAETRVSESEPEDIVQSQRRQIEELERKLEASRQQLETVRREAAGAAASDQSRRLLQAHLCVSQLRAQLDALQQPQAPAAPAAHAPLPQPTRLVLARADTAPDRLVQLFTVTSPAQTANTNDGMTDASPAKNQAYILNGVKVVPIAILPSTHYEPERAHAPPSPPPPPPPPMPQISLPAPLTPLTPLSHDQNEDSQIMDDVLEILVENGELPASAVSEGTDQSLDASYLGSAADTFSPAEMLGDTQIRDTLAAEELQRELNDIQNEILNHADMNANSHHGQSIDSDLSVDLLTSNDFHTDFCSSDPTVSDHDDFFGSLLSGDSNNHMDSLHTPMDIGEDPPERMCMTPLPNGDILDHAQPGFEDMDDLSLPSFNNEESRHGTCDFDFKEVGIDFNTNMNVDNDFMGAQLIPNLFGRGHMPQCDPLLAGVLAPAPRPARKHYSWDKLEFDAT